MIQMLILIGNERKCEQEIDITHSCPNSFFFPIPSAPKSSAYQLTHLGLLNFPIGLAPPLSTGHADRHESQNCFLIHIQAETYWAHDFSLSHSIATKYLNAL